jgi:ATP-binding cassette, subfamily B, putative efflux pump
MEDGSRGRVARAVTRAAPAAGAWYDAGTLLWRQRRPLAIGLLLLAVNRVGAFALPTSTKFFIDVVVGQGRYALVLPLAAGVACAAALTAACSFALARVVGLAAHRTIADLRAELHQHVLRLPIAHFDAGRSGTLAARIIRDTEGVRNLIGTGFAQLVSGAVTAAIAVTMLLRINGPLTVTLILLLGAYLAVMSRTLHALVPRYRELGEQVTQLSGRLAEGLAGIRVLKTYAAEEREGADFVRRLDGVVRANVRTLTGTSTITSGSAFMLGLLGAVVLVGGGRAVVRGEMTLGDFVIYGSLASMALGPLLEVAAIGGQLGEALAGLERMRELRAVPTEERDDSRLAPCPVVEGRVAFENVSFEYVPRVLVLRRVSFDVAPGATVAVVGPSGAGKSTLLGLVMGLYDPSAGRVLIDGRDVTGFRRRDYRRHLGVVLQETFLFDGTIRENIAFARPDASDADVGEAARIAHADEFIARFEHGYDTIVGERGMKLSGGQRQRVAIARAILADPRILLLDEATSSLDSESEALIRDGLQALRRGRTTFVIAHRLSTIESADQILVLEGGEIVERGRHDELLACAGRYRRLHSMQVERRPMTPARDGT